MDRYLQKVVSAESMRRDDLNGQCSWLHKEVRSVLDSCRAGWVTKTEYAIRKWQSLAYIPLWIMVGNSVKGRMGMSEHSLFGLWAGA